MYVVRVSRTIRCVNRCEATATERVRNPGHGSSLAERSFPGGAPKRHARALRPHLDYSTIAEHHTQHTQAHQLAFRSRPQNLIGRGLYGSARLHGGEINTQARHRNAAHGSRRSPADTHSIGNITCDSIAPQAATLAADFVETCIDLCFGNLLCISVR